jgi:uncharacterized protein
MPFEFDPEKSQRNLDKHGIGFEQAQALWEDSYRVVVPATSSVEPRFLMVAKLSGKHWSAIYTLRDGNVRIISVRRSKKREVSLYEQD